MTPDLRLVVNNVAYGGWKSIRVRRSLEEITGTFDLTVSEVWPEQLAPREIRTGDACVVSIGGQPVITGFVNFAGPGYDARSHTFSVRGRDVTGDLADCAAVYQKGEWRNATLAQIARDLGAPFGIPVKVAGDVGAAFVSFAIEPGETVFDCLERAADLRGVRLVSDGIGGLVVGIADPQSSGVALIEGENILSASASNDDAQRFSEYVVKGQQAGTDTVNGSAAAAIKARSRDPGVKRYRPLVVMAEDQGDIAGYQRRADWEASVRAGRALTANVRLQGWIKDARGGLWHPNTLARITAPRLRLDRELLISAVEHVVDESGTFTDLTLAPKEAFSRIPTPAKEKAPKRKRARKRNTDLEDVFG